MFNTKASRGYPAFYTVSPPRATLSLCRLAQACAGLCKFAQACASLRKLEHVLLFCKLLLDLELFLQSTWLSFCQGLLNSIALIFLIFLHLVFLHLLNSVGRGYEIPEHTRQTKTYKEAKNNDGVSLVKFFYINYN